MEVEKGYKKTEVGVIPEDWELVTFGEVFTFLSTASYPRAQLFNDKEIGYVHYGDIHTKWNHFLDCGRNALPSIDRDFLKAYALLKEGDLIMVDASEDYDGIGKSVEVKNLNSLKIISGLHTFLLRDSKKVFINGFKGYICSNPIVSRQFYRLATGLKVYGVSRNNLKSIQIPVPPKKTEQTAISNVLSDTDAFISSLEKLLAKKKKIKIATMQQLLTGKKRLPGFSRKWTTTKFSDVCWFQEGPGVRTSQFTDSGIKLLNGTNINEGKLDLKSTNRFISTHEAFGVYSHFLADEEDIIIACSGISVERFHEKVTILKKEHLPLCMNTSTMRFKITSQKMTRDFLFYFLKSELFKKQISKQATGSAQLNFGPFHVRRAEMSFPEPDEQIAITQILNDINADIEILETKLDKYKMIKLGMMQELLTGKTRLI